MDKIKYCDYNKYFKLFLDNKLFPFISLAFPVYDLAKETNILYCSVEYWEMFNGAKTTRKIKEDFIVTKYENGIFYLEKIY
jgi:hypothetical protein